MSPVQSPTRRTTTGTRGPSARRPRALRAAARSLRRAHATPAGSDITRRFRRAPPTAVFALVGGTGSYAGARGVVTETRDTSGASWSTISNAGVIPVSPDERFSPKRSAVNGSSAGDALALQEHGATLHEIGTAAGGAIPIRCAKPPAAANGGPNWTLTDPTPGTAETVGRMFCRTASPPAHRCWAAPLLRSISSASSLQIRDRRWPDRPAPPHPSAQWRHRPRHRSSRSLCSSVVLPQIQFEHEAMMLRQPPMQRMVKTLGDALIRRSASAPVCAGF